jgi:hypothetical protein
MKRKVVYFNGTYIGYARTWDEAAELVGTLLGRHVHLKEIFASSSEGPDAFYVELRP